MAEGVGRGVGVGVLLLPPHVRALARRDLRGGGGGEHAQQSASAIVNGTMIKFG